MAVYTMADATISIGTQAVVTDLAEYQADTYVAIGEVETISALVDMQNFTQFTGLADSRVRNFKTTKAADNITINTAFDPDDAGQEDLRDASADTSQTSYNFKIVYNDGDDSVSPAVQPTEVYFSGLVGNTPFPGGGAEDVSKTSFTVVNNTGFTVQLRA